jgi:hypothetical protein
MPSTPADLILADLDADPYSSYMTMYGKYDSKLLTIHQKHKCLADHSVKEIELEDHNDGIDSAQNAAEKIRGNLFVTGFGIILLSLASTEDSAAIHFSMYCKAFGLDVTEKTNLEDCLLALCVGLENNNQTFMHTMAFLPLQAKWSFGQFNEVAKARREWKGDAHNAFKSKVEEMNKMLSSSQATDEMWVQANKVLDTLNFDLMVKLQERRQQQWSEQRYSQFAQQCKPCQ